MSYHHGNQLIDPSLLFEKAQLQSGMRVADFGCGRTGHLVFPAAHIVGEKGIVYAVDILKDVLDAIAKRMKADGVLNVHTVWSDVERIGATTIPQQSVDVVFLVNALGAMTDHGSVLGEAKRLLKQKGRLVLVDWLKQGLSFGPKPAQYVNFSLCIDEAKIHGFVLQEQFPVGKYHHGVVLYTHG